MYGWRVNFSEEALREPEAPYLGSFIPGSEEKVVKEDAPEEHYRFYS
jgi:hypothetical protein